MQEEKEVNNIVKDTPTSTNGVGHCEEFSPVEHPLEPPDIDKPVRCPPPEPCIVHVSTPIHPSDRMTGSFSCFFLTSRITLAVGHLSVFSCS